MIDITGTNVLELILATLLITGVIVAFVLWLGITIRDYLKKRKNEKDNN